MADIRDLVEKWDGHTGNEVEKFLKQELGKRQESLRLGAGLGWDEGKLAVRYGRGLNFYSDGTMGVNVGQGLKIESGQVVVNYGTGLKVVNNKLDVDTSKIAGVGIDLDSAYKMLTIGTKAAKELAGTGLAADGPKIKVKYGSGLTTNSCGGLIVDAANLTVGYADHAAVSCSASYASSAGKATADANGNNIADTYLKSVGASGDGISISGGKIAAKCNYGIKITCGYLAIATGDGLHIKDNKLAINPSFGLGFTADGMLKLKLHGKSGLQETTAGLGVNAGVALGTSDGKLNVQYGTGLKVVNNKLDVDTSKIAGVGIDLDSAYKMLTIGTKAAKELAGTGLVADGPKIKLKYGSGLTTNTCGRMIVDAANLHVKSAGSADKLSTPRTIWGQSFDGSGNVTGYIRTPDGVVINAAEHFNCSYARGYGWTIPEGSAGALCFGDGQKTHYLKFGFGAYNAPQGLFCLPNGYIGIGVSNPTSRLHVSGNAIVEGSLNATTISENGNNIATTYAKHFWPGQGMNLSNDSVLSLPNLTASVINGAVDGIKNNKQRVLELSCGAIQIKLSTGLAIDEEGYLYVTK